MDQYLHASSCHVYHSKGMVRGMIKGARLQ